MSSRAWQMVAAGLSIALMVFVIVKYVVLRDEPAPRKASGEVHVGAKHHTEVTAGPHAGTQAAPLEAFANGKVGDWIGYRVLTRSSLLPEPIEGIVLARVVTATDTDVTVEYKGGSAQLPERKQEQWQTVYPRKGLTFDKLTGNDISEWTIFDLTVTDDNHEVGGRTFKCKKLAWSAKDPMFPKKRVRNELWISDEVPVEGLVEERDVQDMENFHSEQTKQLIGFGTADAITWGKKPDV